MSALTFEGVVLGLMAVDSIVGSIKRKTVEDQVSTLCRDVFVAETQIMLLGDDANTMASRIDQIETWMKSEPMHARRIAALTDSTTLQRVWQEATQRPFCIRRLVDLRDFVESPAKAERDLKCKPGAVAAWNAMPRARKTEITSALTSLLNQYPTLLWSIETLYHVVPPFSGYDVCCIADALDHYQTTDETEIADAIEVCMQLH
jgi:hypothetical protein